MPVPTLTERVEELRRDLAAIKISMAREETMSHMSRSAGAAKYSELHSGIEKLQDKFGGLEKSLGDTQKQIATLEAQTKALDKFSDRHWQVWLALGGAVLALLVSLLKK